MTWSHRAQPPPLDPSHQAELRRELERELARMENGTYGLCAGCQQPISSERLSAIRETTVCADCSWTREEPRVRMGVAM